MAVARAHFNLTSTTSSPALPIQSQSWRHSPVPYLFGGLAAMLGLIAFALLILACSFWRLSGYFQSQDGTGSSSGEHDIEAGQHKEGYDMAAKGVVFEEKVLVIMAGENEPRFLATPMSSSCSSTFRGSSISSSFDYGLDEKNGKLEVVCVDVKRERSSQPENEDYGVHSNIAAYQSRHGNEIQDQDREEQL